MKKYVIINYIKKMLKNNNQFETLVKNIFERVFNDSNIVTLSDNKNKKNQCNTNNKLIGNINDKIYEHLKQVILNILNLDLSPKYFYYELKNSLLFSPILEQIEKNTHSSISVEMTILMVFNTIECSLKSYIKHNNLIKLIDNSLLTKYFLEDIVNFIKSSLKECTHIQYQNLLKNMSDNNEIYIFIFNYIFYLGNMQKNLYIDLKYTTECFFKGLITFISIINSSSTDFHNEYYYEYDQWFYITNMEILFKILSNYYLNQKSILIFIMNTTNTKFNSFLDYIKLDTIENDLIRYINKENLYKIYELYLEKIIYNYLPRSNNDTRDNIKKKILLEQPINLLKISSFTHFIKLFYINTDLYSDTSYENINNFPNLNNTSNYKKFYIFIMNQFIKWKYTLTMFRQEYDIDIDNMNKSLDKIEFNNINNECIKTFYYFIYIINREHINKNKLNNKKIKLLYDINISEILNEHNQILSKSDQ
jgi:hypothetical protein